MSEDVASMWLHFACFSSKIVFFCGPLNFQVHLSRFLIPGSVWLEYFVICKVRVDENFTLLPPQGFRLLAKSRGGTLVARAYIKDSTYSTNMQSVYRKNLDLLEQGPRGIGR